MDRSQALTIKLHRPLAVPGISNWADEKTFQIARNSEVRLIISGVNVGSQAESLGLKKGDVILKMNGKPITTQFQYYQVLPQAIQEGVEMKVLREKQEMKAYFQKGDLGFLTEEEYL